MNKSIAKGYGPTGISFPYTFEDFQEDVEQGKVHHESGEQITPEEDLQELFNTAVCFGYTQGRNKKFTREGPPVKTRKEILREMNHKETLQEIQSIMSEQEWSPDTLDAIKEVMDGAGFPIQDTNTDE